MGLILLTEAGQKVDDRHAEAIWSLDVGQMARTIEHHVLAPNEALVQLTTGWAHPYLEPPGALAPREPPLASAQPPSSGNRSQLRPIQLASEALRGVFCPCGSCVDSDS